MRLLIQGITLLVLVDHIRKYSVEEINNYKYNYPKFQAKKSMVSTHAPNADV